MGAFMVGASAVLAIYRGAQRVWEWTGAALFPRFWSGPLDPTGLRLFQDAAGITPANQAGQPVGKVVRADGTVDASQATALSRPTLARWPKGGRRNLLTQSTDLTLASFAKAQMAVAWDASAQAFTLTAGSEAGSVHLSSGYNTAAFNALANWGSSVEVKRGSYDFVRLSGTTVANATRSVTVDLRDGSFVITQFLPGAPVAASVTSLPDGWYRITLHGPDNLPSYKCFALYLTNYSGNADAGAVSNRPVAGQFVYARKPQFEAGPVTAYQAVTNANDITEPGVPDVWHLWNDGGDSLLASLPSGTYEVATVGIAGRPHYASLTGDGSGKNILLGADRIADIFVRAGTLTDAERARLEEYWQERLGAGYLIPPGMVPGTRPMWQEAGGTTPVTAAGQPVGRIDDAFSGVSATQSTALSRPTLARHPKGGVRNVLLKADAPLSGTPWRWSTVTPTSLGAVGPNGSHVTRVIPQVEAIGVGGAGLRGAPWLTGAMVPVGSRWTFSALFKSDGLRYALLGGNNGGGGYHVGAKFDLETGTVVNVFNHPTPVSNVSADIQPAANGFWRCSLTFTNQITHNHTFTLLLSGAINTTAAQQSGDGSSGVLVAEPQIEAGEVATPFQKSVSANDVSEYGVPDVWHLWNDGGDSLPAVLPAGAWEIAWVTPLGAISYASVTSDGTTGTNLLRAERMADVALKRGRFTSYEKAQLETQWGKYKP